MFNTVMMKTCEDIHMCMKVAANVVMPLMEAFHSDFIEDYRTLSNDSSFNNARIIVRKTGTLLRYNDDDVDKVVADHWRDMRLDAIAVVCIYNKFGPGYDMEIHVKQG